MKTFHVEQRELLSSLPLVKGEENRIFLCFPSYQNEDVDLVSDYLLTKKKEGYDLRLLIEFGQKNYTSEEFKVFFSLRSRLSPAGISFEGEDRYQSYSLENLLKADEILDGFIERLKASSLTPLEKYLAIYRYLCKKEYRASPGDRGDILSEAAHLSCDLVSVTLTDNIVCEGYAVLMNYLCQNVGIHSFCAFHSIAHKVENAVNHANNLVFLEDETYGIRGLYYSDVCWDAADDTLAFCLIPLPDSLVLCREDLYILHPSPFMLPYYRLKQFRMFEMDFISENNDGILSKRREKPKEYDQAVKVFLARRKEAVAHLRRIFKEMNFDESLYEKDTFFSPHGTDIPFLIALLLLSADNENTVRHKLQELKWFKECGGYEVPMDGCKLSAYFPHDEHIYFSLGCSVSECLKNLECFPFDETFLHSDAMVNNQYFREDYASQEGLCYEQAESVIHYLKRLLQYPEISRKIEADFPLGEAIAREKIEKALGKALRFEGFDDGTAKREIRSIFNKSERIAEVAFDGSATNCFANKPE